MRLAMIVARARNGVIGNNNQLPWHLPADLRYFKQTTQGKPIIMGRATYDSIGRPLPGRHNIVVSRNRGLQIPGVTVVNSCDAAVAVAAADQPSEAMVIGGAAIYAALLPRINRVYLTEVLADVAGDTFLPALDLQHWRCVSRTDHCADEHNAYDYSFVVYDRACAIET